MQALFYGEFELTIDDKNRILIPAELRKAISPEQDGNGLFIVIGKNREPWLYAENYYRHLASLRQQELSPDDDALAFDQYHFARASRVEWDKQGRLVLPDRTLKRTGTGRQVTLIGARDHMELWNRAEWETRFDELTANEPQARRQGTAGPPTHM